tara:strand:+ start:689 stop:994 length:306 start_codon:yes stop_codon:yes gene_type:complete
MIKFLTLFVLVGFIFQGCSTGVFDSSSAAKKPCCEKNVTKLPKSCSGGYCKLKANNKTNSVGKDCSSCQDKNKNCTDCKDTKRCASNYCPMKASKKSCCKS